VLTIGIVSAGQMGAAIGERINSNAQYQVLTVVEGRSQSTVDRASQANLEASPSLTVLVSSVDILLSILPPSDAIPFATTVASHVINREDKGAGFTFADCNAISPESVRQVRDLFISPITFVDASIIGCPPREGYSPTLYMSGEDDSAVKCAQSLKDCGVTIKTLGGGVGAASALKMSYASMTKGFTALAAVSVLGAAHNNVLPDLLAELAISQPRTLGTIHGAASSLPLKSYRWVGEMEEIASYLGGAGISEGSEVFRGIANVFVRTDREKDGVAAAVLNDASKQAGELLQKSK